MKKIKLVIKSGIITSISESEFVEIISDGKEYKFSDCIVIPGITDSHCHVWGLGMMNSGLDVSGGISSEETLEITRKNYFRKCDWVIGRGWNNELWNNTDLPDRIQADKFFPDEPLALTRVDGHSIWCNSKALELAGIDCDTPDPAGGKILRDEHGSPTGMLIDNAMNLLDSYIPEYTESQITSFIDKGLDLCLKSGITAVHDMDVSPQMVSIYHKLNEAGKLPIRVFAYVSCQNDEVFNAKILPYKSEMFTIQGIKLFSDGALGSYGAALIDDYSDKTGERGLLLLTSNDMLGKILKADESGFDVVIHAIGDRAVREVIDAFEKFRELKPYSTINLRIEHSQTVHPDDIQRYKQLNIIASVQPIHFVSDAKMAQKRLGNARLLKSGYPWKTFIDNEVLVIGGSDFPIESHNPFLGIDAFISRQYDLETDNSIFDERLSESEALKCYTDYPYISVNVENIGKLEIGCKADFVVIEGNSISSVSKVSSVFINGEQIIS
ncbi:MAG: amidohydrolase [Candidatus Kapabacteria bacterium]|nr:amidohydrolase [Ignavibacteriota bacterium]MCW5885819.1 amidohydrolase [Candidatus Kapabacteria bacterium]